MVSNTLQRILSAIAMVAIVLLAVVTGKWTTLLCILAIGVLCIDEVLVNFVQIKRKDFLYRYVLIFFVLFFVVVNVLNAIISLLFLTVAALFLNIFLIYYLFAIPLEQSFMRTNAKKSPLLVTLFVILPFFSLGAYFDYPQWKEILGVLILLASSMDTGAWFVGKNFGKHKLWPAVSPKKTVEGFVGGLVIAAVCGSLAWHYFLGGFRWYDALIFAGCGAIAQVGDLVQSKMKREFNIKDSSNLIPGHGGVYDRLDSLIFLSPFFVIVVKYLGQRASF